MFTRQDYSDYFFTLKEREIAMEQFTDEGQRMFSSERVLKVLKWIGEDETKHVREVNKLFGLAGEYIAASEMSFNPKEFSVSILEMLKDHELIIADLYEAYAEVLDDDEKTWGLLVREEKGHAKIIERLTEQVRNGEAVFAVGVFSTNKLKASMATLKEEIKTVRANPPTHRDAVMKALEIEKSLLEHRFFDVVSIDSDASRIMKDSMRKSVELHVGRVRKMLEQL
jgi:rubrerythrin